MHRAVVGSLLIALLGCQIQSKQLYPGPARPYAEIAILERESGRGIVRFQAIDGVEVKGSGFYVLPGEHVIQVTNRVQLTLPGGHSQPGNRTVGSQQISVERLSQSVWVEVPCTATFVAEAGRTYFVRGDLEEVLRDSMHPTLRPGLWVAARNAPQLNVAKHRCRLDH